MLDLDRSGRTDTGPMVYTKATSSAQLRRQILPLSGTNLYSTVLMLITNASRTRSYCNAGCSYGLSGVCNSKPCGRIALLVCPLLRKRNRSEYNSDFKKGNAFDLRDLATQNKLNFQDGHLAIPAGT